MTARPFELEECPRVRARHARATRAALPTCARVPTRWSVDLPPLGSASMAFTGIDADAERPNDVDLVVSFGVGRGRVSVEGGLATRLVDVVLGGREVLSPARAVGPAERGVLVGILAPVFDRIGGSLQLAPAAARGSRDGGGAALTFALQTAVASGWLRLRPPAGAMTLTDEDRAEIWRARAGRLPVSGHLELATTRVPAAALAGAGVGDAVVFDDARASGFGPDAPWNGRLRIGEHVAEFRVDVDGKLSLAGGFCRLQHEEGSMSVSGSDTDATTVLAAASIEVVAELGRVELRGEEVLGLAPGAVLALGARRDRVALRVGGELWADGELVDVDGELGVRITRLANR